MSDQGRIYCVVCGARIRDQYLAEGFTSCKQSCRRRVERWLAWAQEESKTIPLIGARRGQKGELRERVQVPLTKPDDCMALRPDLWTLDTHDLDGRVRYPPAEITTTRADW